MALISLVMINGIIMKYKNKAKTSELRRNPYGKKPPEKEKVLAP